MLVVIGQDFPDSNILPTNLVVNVKDIGCRISSRKAQQYCVFCEDTFHPGSCPCCRGGGSRSSAGSSRPLLRGQCGARLRVRVNKHPLIADFSKKH